MKKQNKNVRETLKNIPSIDEILSTYQLNVPSSIFKTYINNILDKIRNDIINGKEIKNIKVYINNKVKKIANELSSNSLKQVINGTGIILHTGLGRAPISKEILYDSINNTFPYTNLEFNLDTGERGDRNVHLVNLFNCLCDSESSLIVNNNAAAVMLMLNSLCENKDVIISRGQQVEIGGSFRIPDVIAKSGCNMIEVGTTNKTHLKDYKNSITKDTGAILYVHTSNFKVVGFTNSVKINDLSKLAKQNNIPLIIDLGSGSIADYKSFGLPMEKMVNKYIQMGVDIISFSGDKLLGGPQAGILVGKEKIIKTIYKNPIYRAVRCDKVRLSMMESILKTYYSSKNISDKNLSVQLFKRNRKELKQFALKILNKIPKKIIDKYKIEFNETFVEAGSGSLPNKDIPSIAIVIKKYNNMTRLYKKFLACNIPLIGYINNNIFHIDLKAIPHEQSESLSKTINEVLK